MTPFSGPSLSTNQKGVLEKPSSSRRFPLEETKNIPSQLRIGYEVILHLAHNREKGFSTFADKTICDGSDGLTGLEIDVIAWKLGMGAIAYDIISSPNCECHSVTHKIRISEERDVCTRMIAIDVPVKGLSG
jgi:hypothetical protein